MPGEAEVDYSAMMKTDVTLATSLVHAGGLFEIEMKIHIHPSLKGQYSQLTFPKCLLHNN